MRSTVVLPAVQAEFGVDRADASLPYTLTMIGFGFGGILMGRLADRFGVMVPLMVGAIGLAFGLHAPPAWPATCGMFTLVQGLLLGLLGTSATFAPLMADTSLWFTRRRGIAVGICVSGNYLAGAVWPPIIQHFIETAGWRADLSSASACSACVTMLPLALVYRRRPPAAAPVPVAPIAATAQRAPRGSPNVRWA